MKGWIKLHRNIMQSETFSKLNAIQQLIAIYIILNANHEDGIWYDKYKNIEVPVKRGQLITSRKKIAAEWCKGDKEVTEQKIRTTLKKLERLDFLTITSTNNYTLLEVLNYNVYQKKEEETNQVVNQDLTKSQPRDNQEITTNKNVKELNKNDKNEKKKKTISHKFETCDMEMSQQLFSMILENNENAKKPNMKKWANEFRLMREQDKRTEEQIRYLIDWTQNDSFWKSNILSPSKLRKQFDQLVIRVKEDIKKHNQQDRKPKAYQSLQDWADEE
jgi:hypothetical protein